MPSLSSLQPHPLLFSPFPGRARAPPRTHFGFCTKIPSSPLRRESVVVRLIPNGELPDFESIEGFAQKLFDRAEGIIYTIADAAASSPDAVTEGSKRTGDWLSGITGYMETVLKVLKDGLSALHVPYSYGFAIILLTVLVKVATFPLTKKQVESALAMRSLQPQVKAIQQRYAGDRERIQLETARLYKLAGVNPLAGCLPTLATIPVWIGLYRALSNVADEGLLSEAFFWIPSLAGPTTVGARQSGSGTSWLFPFIDGHPPLGWSDTLAYLVLPVLLVVSQYISAQIMQPSQGTDPSQKNAQAVTKLLPLMIGYFALSVPSGLSLYWFTNNILSTAQQVWLQKLGGAKNPVNQYGDGKTRDEPSKIQNSVSNIEKSVLDIDTEKEKSSQGENADLGRLRPGERFKQLKEQEERRRKQREEEEKRTEAVAASSHLTIEHQNMEVESVENKVEQVNDQQGSEKSLTKLHMSATSNGGLNCNAASVVMDEENPHPDLQKEEVAEMHGSAGNQACTHDALDRRDQDTERGEN